VTAGIKSAAPPLLDISAAQLMKPAITPAAVKATPPAVIRMQINAGPSRMQINNH